MKRAILTGRGIVIGAAITLNACRGDNVPTMKIDTAAVATNLPPGENYLAVPGGRIWYKVSGEGSGTPVILLHGGPGFTSVYMKSLEQLGADRKVIRYDQLGSGNSTKVSDTAMFNIPHFVAELEALRAHLGYDKVHLFGHSWGAILGLEYYRAHPEHVASLIEASPALDIPAWEKHARDLVKTLPDSMQRVIAKREAEGNFEAPDYQAALMEFYGKYVWQRPVQPELDSIFAGANQGIYNYMQGPSEFTITGTLKKYDATPYLKDVKVPTLFMVGELDEANPATVKRFAAMTPGSEFAVVPNAAHIFTWDNPKDANRLIMDFLRSTDSR
ncbi:MAG: proline iminopeptidase-family hydrolase [Gemmatimonadaceae bacterium]|nr:proline iminopeptidase-family hydrolase [Gemmatimonadaceae bacterium]